MSDKPEWIAVSERLPKLKAGEAALWYQPEVVRGRANYSLNARVLIETCKPVARETTHWMPLPGPPDTGE